MTPPHKHWCFQCQHYWECRDVSLYDPDGGTFPCATLTNRRCQPCNTQNYNTTPEEPVEGVSIMPSDLKP